MKNKHLQSLKCHIVMPNDLILHHKQSLKLHCVPLFSIIPEGIAFLPLKKQIIKTKQLKYLLDAQRKAVDREMV